MKTILILIFLDALIRNSVVIQSCRQRRGKERRYYKKSDFFFYRLLFVYTHQYTVGKTGLYFRIMSWET